MNPAPVDIVSALISYGPLGLVTAWLMLRGERKLEVVADRIDKLSHRINGITKAMLVEVISRDNPHNGAARMAAERMLREMEASQQVDRGE